MDFVPTFNSIRMRHANNVRKPLLLAYIYLSIISQICISYAVEWEECCKLNIEMNL